ncbi:hypothetical protein ACO1O0_000960 [Amphichorda felina]
MGWMSGINSLARDERVILLSIGLATFGVVSTMVTALIVIRDDTILPKPQPKTRYITQDTEDALEVDTLEKLLEHPSYSIREIATKILCDRSVNSQETIRRLLYGITRPDYNERIQSLRALALLTNFDGLSSLHHPDAYSALVRSLELSLDDVERPSLEDYHWDEYYLRDMAEKFCLMFIQDLVNKNGASMLVKAKFVDKWLAKQDWGSTPLERRRRFAEYMEYKSNRIVDIVNRIRHSRRGVRALEKAGLIGERHARRQIRELPDLVMEIEPAELIASVEGPDSQLPRTREQSEEEQRLRRQHREAMVLNDGTRPLGREDIIERDHSSPD